VRPPEKLNYRLNDEGFRMNKDELHLIEKTEQRVRERMAGQQSGHGVDHVLRVVRLARQIQAEAGGDPLIIELAAWLHDIGDAKFHKGVERSGEFSRELLNEFGSSQETREHVVHIVDNISFRKRVDAKELSLEGKVVQDADRLDALGAIGIVRTIEYGAVVGEPFYLPENHALTSKTGVQHFHDKLFKLPGLLNTEPARRMAGQREQFMRAFIDQFLLECGQHASDSSEV